MHSNVHCWSRNRHSRPEYFPKLSSETIWKQKTSRTAQATKTNIFGGRIPHHACQIHPKLDLQTASRRWDHCWFLEDVLRGLHVFTIEALWVSQRPTIRGITFFTCCTDPEERNKDSNRGSKTPLWGLRKASQWLPKCLLDTLEKQKRSWIQFQSLKRPLFSARSSHGGRYWHPKFDSKSFQMHPKVNSV